MSETPATRLSLLVRLRSVALVSGSLRILCSGRRACAHASCRPGYAICHAWSGLLLRRYLAYWRESSDWLRIRQRLDVRQVQKLEISLLPGSRIAVHRVFITFAQKSETVRTLQIFDSGWIAPEFLEIPLHCPCVLTAAMDQFLFPVTLTLMLEILNRFQ